MTPVDPSEYRTASLPGVLIQAYLQCQVQATGEFGAFGQNKTGDVVIPEEEP